MLRFEAPTGGMAMKNRRSEKRVRIPGKMGAVITFSDALQPAGGGTIGDISPNGMFMLTKSVLYKDAYVNMKIHTENLMGKSIHIQGLVIRTDDKGMAIKFTYANEDDLSTLLNS
jgi:hypothetical protein